MKIEERSFEAQDAFLTDLFEATLHGPLPAETQKKLFDAAAGMQSRCQTARQSIECSLERLRGMLALASSNEMNLLYARIDELKSIQKALQ